MTAATTKVEALCLKKEDLIEVKGNNSRYYLEVDGVEPEKEIVRAFVSKAGCNDVIEIPFKDIEAVYKRTEL